MITIISAPDLAFTVKNSENTKKNVKTIDRVPYMIALRLKTCY